MAEAETLTLLENTLRKRVQIIADHQWRDQDPSGHLDALRQVSEAIMELQSQLPPNTNSKLLHYLQRSSYTKVLEYLEAAKDEKPTHF